jgi:hypothetical protein
LSDFTADVIGAFSTDELCRTYSIGKTMLYAELKAGRLQARKIGRRTLIDRGEARRWFASLPSYH